MCEPLTIATFAATAGGGIMSATAKHRAAKRAAERQNYINELTYNQNLKIAEQKDQVKAQRYTRELQARAAAESAVYRQQELNQLERTRVSIASQEALEETKTEVTFDSEAKLIASIQAQGEILSGEGASGQSMLLQLMDTERQLGMAEAQLDQRLTDANKAYRLKEYGFDLDKYSQDVRSLNQLPGAPVAAYASFEPVRMPEVAGPSGLGLLGGIVSSVGAGIGAGINTEKSLWQMNQPQGGGK